MPQFAQCATPRVNIARQRMDRAAEGWLPKGLRLRGKAHLIETLRGWLMNSAAPTIGDTSGFHGRFWVSVEIGNHRIRLAADTTREAVQRVVDEIATHPDRPWRVVANEQGRVNKVLPTLRVEPGWYAYLIRPLDAETEI